MPTSFSDIVYTRTPQRPLRLDLRLPQAPGRPPLVVFIPMGGFRVCEKENAQHWLADFGFATASIECRVRHEAPAPASIQDCKEAVRFLRARAGDFGYDGARIGVWGQSAGGILASLLATSGDSGIAELEGPSAFPGTSTRIQAAWDDCGAPHDLAYFARPEVKARFAPVYENLRLYLGGTVEEKAGLARLVSPATYISRTAAPIFLAHGDADPIVPVEETVAFHAALKAAGADATLRVLPGAGHAWDPALTRDDLVAFFRRMLGPG